MELTPRVSRMGKFGACLRIRAFVICSPASIQPGKLDHNPDIGLDEVYTGMSDRVARLNDLRKILSQITS
jgi:hypothetical protein